LIVITAQTGNEYPDTGHDVERQILPLLRRHGIRFVQLARHGHLEADGITVLSDTRQPTTVYLDGDYRLSDELRKNGTVPMCSGVHKCALKFKAFVIESWIAQNLTGPARHAIGYNADETSRVAHSEYVFQARVAFGFNSEETGRFERANEYDGLRQGNGHKVAFGYNADETGRIEKNCEYNTVARVAFYPLVAWGWNRQTCIDYLQTHLGVTWRKSACVFCPFACNRQNAAELIERHREHPEQVAEAMVLEHVSLAMNPRGTLYKTRSLIEITQAAGNTSATAAYEERLSTAPWALYRVRRIYHADKKIPTKKGQADRAVERLAVLSRDSAHTALLRLAGRLQAQLVTHRGIDYAYQEHKGDTYPTREHFYVTAPAVVETKARYGIEWFNGKWDQQSLF
jgi:hypothetical protein